MSTEVRHRRGTTAQHATFTGALAEITIDTSKKTAVVHDGATAGGIPLAREDSKNDNALGYQQDVKTNDYTVVVGDIGKMLVANKATAINFTLGTAAALTSKFVAGFKNIGVGVLSITPNGAELIDGVNAAIPVPAGASLILKGDGTAFRTFVSNGDVTGSAINNAPALVGANLANNDKLAVYDVSAGLLTSMLYSELLAGTFKTSRTIVNAQFDAASFKLYNAAGTPRAVQVDATALTADRTATMPDRNVNLGNVPLSGRFKSSQQTATLGGLLSIPHGLGAVPDISTLYASVVNTSGGTVNGFPAGAELRTKTDNVGSAVGVGIEVWADATNINARIGNSVMATTINGGTGVGNENLLPASWKVCLGCQL